ncbi:IPTL-CTERM sorting domain-containing protein [Azoarcus sp. L1K30]|uniref:IPTL-CTERM sorting domain-containing protein n=1 Tax=Azoarcus sp. L1K30 TaxID=2820277 RepID=UPI001B827E7C|nr:IPTL-CTERM sorting domain-containing protein [Azoarcus sp. L1K30]MBR0567487.1 IPTL-CTERM sorting domain-containing protein [Azoarcus sp. L1K30]
MTVRPLLKIGASLLFAFSMQAFAQVTVPVGGSVSVPPGGSMNLACTDLLVQGAMNVNSGSVTQGLTVGIDATGVLNGGSGSITLSGDWNNLGTFVPGSGTVVLTDGCASGSSALTGSTVFNNLTLSSTSGHTYVIPSGSSITVNGTLTLQGTVGQPISVVSSSGSPATILLGPGATVVRSNANVSGNVFIGAPASTTAIPTLNAWALAILAMLMAVVPLIRRRVAI